MKVSTLPLMVMLLFTGGWIWGLRSAHMFLRGFLVFVEDIPEIESKMYRFNGTVLSKSMSKEGMTLRTNGKPTHLRIDKSLLQSWRNEPPQIDILNLEAAIKNRSYLEIKYRKSNYLRVGLGLQDASQAPWIYSISTPTAHILDFPKLKKEIEESYFFSKILLLLIGIGVVVYMFALGVGWFYYANRVLRSNSVKS